jgi:hypothetical protein
VLCNGVAHRADVNEVVIENGSKEAWECFDKQAWINDYTGGSLSVCCEERKLVAIPPCWLCPRP